MLADGSASAGYLALAAVAQWTDPPGTAVLSDDTELPVPALEDIGSALAEWGGVDETLATGLDLSVTGADKSGNAPAATPAPN